MPSRTRPSASPPILGFSGVGPVDRDGKVRLAETYGLAHRGWGVANTVDTWSVIASGT
jgi:hypothetical protein